MKLFMSHAEEKSEVETLCLIKVTAHRLDCLSWRAISWTADATEIKITTILRAHGHAACGLTTKRTLWIPNIRTDTHSYTDTSSLSSAPNQHQINSVWSLPYEQRTSISTSKPERESRRHGKSRGELKGLHRLYWAFYLISCVYLPFYIRTSFIRLLVTYFCSLEALFSIPDFFF